MKITESGNWRFSKRYFLWVLFLFLFFRLILNALVPIMDSSEARYAVICKNMSESGDYVEPRFIYQGEEKVFSGKPPLVFQMGALACKVLGANPFSVRFPAFLGALFILLLVGYVMKILSKPGLNYYAVLFCVSTFFFYLYAGLCMIDMLLSASITGSVVAYMFFTGRDPSPLKKGYSILFFASLGIGMMIKGPIALVLPGLPIFFFILINHRWKEFKDHSWIIGPIVFLCIVTPWYWVMSNRYPDFLRYFLLHENLERFVLKEYGDRFGAGRETFIGISFLWFFLINTTTCFLIFLPLFKKKERRLLWAKEIFSDPLEGMSLLFLLTNTIFLSISSRIMLAYLLPTVPFFCIYLTCRLEALGYFKKVGFVRYLQGAFVGLLVLIPLSMGIAAYCAQVVSAHLPEPFYQKVAEFIQKDPELQKHKLYFVARTPYSAEFYLKEKVRNHSNETEQESLDKCGEDLLLIADQYRKQITIPANRTLLLQYYQWSLYAPPVPMNSKKEQITISNH